MNIDWTELEKGLSEELKKTSSETLEKDASLGAAFKALGPLMLRGARAAAPYVASGIENTGEVLGAAGDKLNAGVKGFGGWAAPHVADAIEGTGNLLGKHTGKVMLGGAAATPALMEKFAPETHKELLNQKGLLSVPYWAADKALGAYRGAKDLIGIGGDAVQGVSQAGSDLVNAVTPTSSQVPSDGSISGNIHSMREGGKSIWGTLTGLTSKIRSGADWVKNTGSDLYNAGTKGINDYFGGMGDMGKYVPAIGGLLAGGIGAYLLNRKKPREESGYGGRGPAININVGGGGPQGRGMPPGFLNYDPTQVQSFGSYKQGSLLKGADIVDALSGAVGRRMADKVLNNATGVKKETHHEEHPKALEITSKHPHMTKLLKNKKNKAYLENLLKEE